MGCYKTFFWLVFQIHLHTQQSIQSRLSIQNILRHRNSLDLEKNKKRFLICTAEQLLSKLLPCHNTSGKYLHMRATNMVKNTWWHRGISKSWPAMDQFMRGNQWKYFVFVVKSFNHSRMVFSTNYVNIPIQIDHSTETTTHAQFSSYFSFSVCAHIKDCGLQTIPNNQNLRVIFSMRNQNTWVPDKIENFWVMWW